MCRRFFSLKCLLASMAVLWLAGCPGPVLNISPTAVSLDGATPSAAITISNGGAGSLSWEIGDRPAWLNAAPLSGQISGQSQLLHLTSNTTGLAAGTYTGEVRVSSNGGDRNIGVVLTVVAPPTLEVTPLALDFGGSETERSVVVRNAGAGALAWTLSVAPPAAYTLNKTSGSLVSGGSETVLVTLNRSMLVPGPNHGTMTFGSNGGSVGVTLDAVVQALQVTPLNLSFGDEATDLPITITNSGSTPLNWTINTASLPPWAEVSSNSGTLAAGANETVLCTVDRTDVGPGVTEATFTVGSDGGSETVHLSVEGPDPVMFVTPLTLDFGSTDLDKEVTIQNTGTGVLSWTIEEGTLAGATWTAGDQPWLDISAVSGDTGSGDADAITVTVDRTQSPPDPDTPHQAWLRIYSEDGEDVFITVSQITLPPTLRVLPQAMVFSTVYINRQLAIWNGGLGLINWRIDTAGKPAWATLTPVDGGGIASGSVSGDATDVVSISVDRTGMTPADADYAWTFEVTAEDGTGADVESKTVTVTMNVAREAAVAVDTGSNADGVPNIDQGGIHFLPFGTAAIDRTFTVANTGTAPLVWSIDDSEFPDWVINISPMQATLQPGETIAVEVTIDREGLPYGEQSHVLLIESNDPNNPQYPVRIELQVPQKVIIGARPKEIALGTYGVSDTFEVANLGDPGSTLNFEVTCNKPWLYFYPETGASEGTNDIIKNWVAVNISVDRAQLDGTGSSAELTIRAYETDPDGNKVYLENIQEQVVKVSVAAAALTIESSWAKLRIPSMVRFVMLMRDIAYQPIPLPYDMLDEVVQGVTVYEKDVPIDLQETNKFLTPGNNLRTNLVILMDYSGSMFEAAKKVLDPEISGAADPLQALYNRCVGQLIDELPANYRVALMEFHDRDQFSRIVTAPDDGPVFTNDKAVLAARLLGMHVTDHGATELLPAAVDAALTLLDYDYDSSRIPFDDAEVAAVVCISDGRLTTPPGKIKEVTDGLWNSHIRYFGVGWGDAVLHEPLARLSNGSGGHYYPTAKVASGELDDQDKPIMVPDADALFDWCETLAPEVDPCDQSIVKDLQSQVVFSYVSLTEDTGITIRLDASFDNPNDDDSVCLVEQGTISGSLVQKNFDLTSNIGDVQMGQISMRSEGLLLGEATVVIRAEYMPRNVSMLQFEITGDSGEFTAELVPAIAGGLVENWTLTPPTLPGDHVYTLEGVSPAPYGASGDLLYLNFTGVVAPELTVRLDVLDPTFSLDEFAKYFIYPDTITVGADPFLAPAFPTPWLDVEYLDLGSDQNGADIRLRNIGGHQWNTFVQLDWLVTTSSDAITAYPDNGMLESTTEEDIVHVGFSRTAEPGIYWEFLTFEFTCGQLGVSYTREIPVFAWIENPVLAVGGGDLAGTTLDFGDTETELGFEIRNEGQSVLDWAIDPTAFPEWLGVWPLGDETVNGTPSTVSVTINRDKLTSGQSYNTQFTIYSTYGQETITVLARQP